MAAMSALPFMEPLHILGSGSIGLLWASSIRSAFPSYPLAVLFRPHHKSRITEKEIAVCTRQNKRPRMARVPAQFIGDENNIRRPIRNLILATKAYQAADAVQSILPRLDPKQQLRIVVLSNGALDVRETLIDTLARNNIHNPQLVMCTTSNGVYQEPPDEDMFHLVQVGIGRTFLGGLPDLAQLWDHSGLNATSVEPKQMEILLWQKLTADCLCNPLAALWQVPNGMLSDNPSFAFTREQIVNEISQVGQTLHPELEGNLSSVKLDGFVEQVIQDNLDNHSSMYHDVQKRQRTEVENLNGYIVRKGKELGIDTPANNELLQLIREIK